MENQIELNQKLEELTNRVEQLEKQISKLSPVPKCTKADKDNFYTTGDMQKYYNGSPFISPEDLKPNIFTFAGNYLSKDGSIGSRFGACISQIDLSLNYNSTELAKILEAYANEDRLNIIKLLLESALSAKELMEKLNFKTTGKLYHHLSILENLGIIYKNNEVYHLHSYSIGCSIMIINSASRLISRFEEHNKQNK